MYVDTKENIVKPKPTLKDLAHVLRHKELWPKFFEWDFRYCSTCAIGLCQLLYGVTPGMLTDFSNDFTGEDVTDIFTSPVFGFKHLFQSRETRMQLVTPEIVAQRIDAYLAR